MNVIVAIMTNENGLFRQTIESATSEVNGMGQVPYLDVAGTVSAEGGRVSIFILNRDLSQPHSLEPSGQERTPSRVLAAFVLSGDDLKASNSFQSPQRVAPRLPAQPLLADSRRTLEVPARSCPVLELAA
jgi:alpha-L-arabinofuranosidase